MNNKSFTNKIPGFLLNVSIAESFNVFRNILNACVWEKEIIFCETIM